MSSPPLFSFVQNWTGSGAQQITAVTSSFFQSMSEAEGGLGYYLRVKHRNSLGRRLVVLMNTDERPNYKELCFHLCFLSYPVGLEFFNTVLVG